jgi:hypothetical protein
MKVVRIKSIVEKKDIEVVSFETWVSKDVTRQHNVTNDSYHHGFEIDMD